MSTQTSTFATAVATFVAATERHAALGAADTEPRAIFAELLDDALTYGTATVPTTARGWELYTNKAGAQRAALDLHLAAVEVVKMAHTDTAAANAILGR